MNSDKLGCSRCCKKALTLNRITAHFMQVTHSLYLPFQFQPCTLFGKALLIVIYYL